MIEVEFEGTILICEAIEMENEYEDGAIVFKNLQPGDTYIGKRNTGWQMGTVSERLWNLTRTMGYMYGNESIYPYNIGECLKVLSIKE